MEKDSSEFDLVIPQQEAISIKVDREHDLIVIRESNWPDEDVKIFIQGPNIEYFISCLQSAFEDLRA